MVKKIFFLIFLFSQISNLFCAEKIALVVGNQNYKKSPLNNPVNDAVAIKKELEKIGFEVIYGEDLDVKKFDNLLENFYKKSSRAKISLFYYSGHGMQNSDSNYLLPVNSDITSESELKRKAINFSDIQKGCYSSGCERILFILDACRNNPLKKTRGGERGLRPVTSSEVVQSMIIFSCAPGETADDGNGEHSPFTESLLKYISKNDNFQNVIMAVTKDVREKTKDRQIPWKQDNTSSHIYLAKEGHELKYIDDVSYRVNKIDFSFVLLLVIACLLIFITFFILFTYRDFFLRNIQVASVKAKNKGKQLYKKYEVVSNALKNSATEGSATENSNAESKNEMKNENEEIKKDDSGEKLESILDYISIKNSFYCTKTLITNEQFDCIQSEENNFTSDSVSNEFNNFPKTNVSFLEAVNWCNEISRKENLEPCYDTSNPDDIKFDANKNGWRLPSENELKKCILKSDETVNKINKLKECKTNIANEFGLYDMTGLVWQWCNNSIKGKQLLKGGAWDSDVKYYKRNKFIAVSKNLKSDAIGFRCVRNR